MNQIPNPFGQYELIEVLGEGRLSTVYRAVDRNSTDEVAVKILPLGFLKQQKQIEYFRKRTEQSAALNHPNLIKLYEWGNYENHPYIVMELMKGKSFDELLKDQEELTLNKGLSILSQIASAIDYGHKEGITHQDIKPSNLFIDKNGHLTVTDLGFIESLTASNQTFFSGMGKTGTLAYIAPEQADPNRVNEITTATDVYSLGIFAYRLLTGHVPFPDNGLATLNAHLNLEPPDPCSINSILPRSVGNVLLRALAKEPSTRYQTANSFVLALRKAALLREEAELTIPYPTLIMTVAGLIFSFMLSSITVMLNKSLPPQLPQVDIAGISASITAKGTAIPSENLTALPTATRALPTLTATINQNIAVALNSPTATNSSIPTQKQATTTELPTATSSLTKSPTAKATKSPTESATESPTESPTETATEMPTETVTETATEADPETATEIPTEPATSTQVPSPIPTETPTPIPTETATAVPPPSQIPTQIPTITQRAATPIPLPTLSSPPPPPTDTPLPPTATVNPYPVPSLLEPPSRAIINGPTLLRWTWNGKLGANEYFDVRVWKEGEPHYGVTWTTDTEYVYDPKTKGEGQFFWSVAVIRGRGGQREVDLTEEAAPQFFIVEP